TGAPRQAELLLELSVEEEPASEVEEVPGEGIAPAAPDPHVGEALAEREPDPEEEPLQRIGVARADGDTRGDLLPDPRDAQEDRRLHLAEVLRDRLDALREVRRGAGRDRDVHAEELLGDVAERQIREHTVIGRRGEVDARDDDGVREIRPRQHRALWGAGRPGCVHEHRDIGEGALVDEPLEALRLPLCGLAAQALALGERAEPPGAVAAQAPWVGGDDPLQAQADRTRAVVVVGPGVLAPDTESLLAERHVVGALSTASPERGGEGLDRCGHQPAAESGSPRYARSTSGFRLIASGAPSAILR